VDTQLAGRVETGPLGHELLVGVDYRRVQDDRTAIFDFSVAPTDLFDPLYDQPIDLTQDFV
jgi:iron complex outermembrane recepter protein